MVNYKNINIYKDNYEKVWIGVRKNLEIWNRMNLSLLGRIAAIKMNVLPKMLFYFQTIPIISNTAYFKEWQKEIVRFIWNGKRPQIKYKILTDIKERGGKLEKEEAIELEGHDNRFGLHAYLWYEKAKVHIYFLQSHNKKVPNEGVEKVSRAIGAKNSVVGITDRSIST